MNFSRRLANATNYAYFFTFWSAELLSHNVIRQSSCLLLSVSSLSISTSYHMNFVVRNWASSGGKRKIEHFPLKTWCAAKLLMASLYFSHWEIWSLFTRNHQTRIFLIWSPKSLNNWILHLHGMSKEFSPDVGWGWRSCPSAGTWCRLVPEQHIT